MFKKILCVCFLFVGCTSANQNQPVLTTSVAPFASLLQEIVGERFLVVNITGNASNAEDIDLSLENIEKIRKSKVYFSFFLPFEQLIEKKALLPSAQIVRLDKVVKELSFSDTTEQVESLENKHHEEDHHSAKDLDPHIWTSPKQMMKILNESVKIIQNIDPDHKQEFWEQFLRIKSRLELLDQELTTIASKLQDREFLVFHPAFGYIAYDYDLKQIAIEKEGKETSLRDMKDVIDIIQKKHLKILFLQQEFPEGILNGLKKETGINIVKINPLAPDYEDQMRIFIEGLA